MTTSLERVWSEGLETASAQRVRAETKEAWHSFAKVFMAWTEYVNSLRENAGLGPMKIEEFPLRDTGLAKLNLDPDTPERRYYQLQIAAMYVFQDLMESVQSLDNPTAHEIDDEMDRGWRCSSLLEAMYLMLWLDLTGGRSIVKCQAKGCPNWFRQGSQPGSMFCPHPDDPLKSRCALREMKRQSRPRQA
jgi:hypothetical protein